MTEITHIFRHIALQARHQLHMCVLAKTTGTLRFYDLCNCYHIENYHSSTSYHPLYNAHSLHESIMDCWMDLSRKRVTSGHSLCVQRRKIMGTINYMSQWPMTTDKTAVDEQVFSHCCPVTYCWDIVDKSLFPYFHWFRTRWFWIRN